MDKLKMHSPDLTEQNIARLAELFPNCVTEAEGEDGQLKRVIDFDQLRQELSGTVVDGPRERYHLDWPGKKEALFAANTPIAKALRPCREDSVNFDTTANLFVEGDNLDALKLLQETYLNKIGLIYVDPPYNTGSDFIYEDDFAENAQEYFRRSQQTDEQGNRLVANTESNGRFHSDWLSMIYSRLKLARNLLRDDGVIFISIDDGEQDNLKKVCDEIFGAENFINTISVNMKNIAGASGGGEDKRLKKNIEFIHVYAKKYTEFSSFANVYEFIPIDELVQSYKEQGKSWKYTSVLMDPGRKEYIGSTVDGDGNEISIHRRSDPQISSVAQVARDLGISESEVYSTYSTKIFQTQMPQSSIRPRVMEKVQELKAAGDLFSIEYVPRSGRNKGVLYEQFYKGDNFRLFAWLGDVCEEIDGKLYKKEMQGTYWDFASETKNLSKEGGTPFPNGKKPIALLKRLLTMQHDHDVIVLDFFAGSSSTAHAVIAQNTEDGGNRKFIMVQLPEPADPKSEAYKSGFKTIADISKERIRLAGRAIVSNVDTSHKELDIGFRAFKIDSSNMKGVYYSPDNVKQEDLLDQIENIKEDRTPEDLLFQVLLDWGVDLSLPIAEETIEGKTVFFVDGNALAACFDKDISEELVKTLAARKPLRAVFRDSGYGNDSVKINVEQIFKLISPSTEVKSI